MDAAPHEGGASAPSATADEPDRLVWDGMIHEGHSDLMAWALHVAADNAKRAELSPADRRYAGREAAAVARVLSNRKPDSGLGALDFLTGARPTA